MSGRARARHRGERGFTLAEIMIAALLAFIGFAGVLSLHISTSRGNYGASRFSEGTTIATQTLEELRSLSIPQIESGYGPLPIDQLRLPDATGRAGLVYQRWLDVRDSDLSPELIHLRVEVRWAEEGAEVGSDDGRWDHSTSLELVRTRREAL